jgi:hypothetical protein
MYLGAVVVVLSALRQTASAMRLASVRRHVGVSWRTLRRWAAWWQNDFAESRFWKASQGLLTPPAPTASSLPAALIAAFGGDDETRLVSMLCFVAPVTTATAKSDPAL